MTRNQRLIIDALFLGVVGALSAQLYMFLLNGSQNFFLGWLVGASDLQDYRRKEGCYWSFSARIVVC